MNIKGGVIKGLIVIVLLAIISTALFVNGTHIGKATWNLWFGSIQKMDDVTNYKTKKEVEDTCRAMISSYEADRLVYEQYKRDENEEKRL